MCTSSWNKAVTVIISSVCAVLTCCVGTTRPLLWLFPVCVRCSLAVSVPQGPYCDYFQCVYGAHLLCRYHKALTVIISSVCAVLTCCVGTTRPLLWLFPVCVRCSLAVSVPQGPYCDYFQCVCGAHLLCRYHKAVTVIISSVCAVLTCCVGTTRPLLWLFPVCVRCSLAVSVPQGRYCDYFQCVYSAHLLCRYHKALTVIISSVCAVLTCCVGTTRPLLWLFPVCVQCSLAVSVPQGPYCDYFQCVYGAHLLCRYHKALTVIISSVCAVLTCCVGTTRPLLWLFPVCVRCSLAVSVPQGPYCDYFQCVYGAHLLCRYHKALTVIISSVCTGTTRPLLWLFPVCVRCSLAVSVPQGPYCDYFQCVYGAHLLCRYHKALTVIISSVCTVLTCCVGTTRPLLWLFPVCVRCSLAVSVPQGRDRRPWIRLLPLQSQGPSVWNDAPTCSAALLHQNKYYVVNSTTNQIILL